MIKKTFETWMVIARGVEAARKRADTFKDRKKSFERILEAQGLSAVLGKTPSSVHSTSVRLLKILENELEVMAWRRTITSWERLQWSGPTTIYKHFPKFKAERETSAKDKPHNPTPTERIKEREAKTRTCRMRSTATLHGRICLSGLRRCGMTAISTQEPKSRACPAT